MVYDMIYAHMVYFCAYACSDKNARESGVGRVQFYASVNRLKKNQTKTKKLWHSKVLQCKLAHPGHNFASS